MKICVIGDVILDMYPKVSGIKVSPEAPVLDAAISTPIELWKARHGGAENVAENMANINLILFFKRKNKKVMKDWLLVLECLLFVRGF